MKNVLSFFRVFDLAFFAPGAVLLWALTTTRMLPGIPSSVEAASPGGLVGLVFFIALIYVLGLGTHAVVRLIKEFRGRLKSGGEKAEASWYLRIGAEEQKESPLLFYFWYLRATCWNLACALFVSGIIFCSPQNGRNPILPAILFALAFFLFTLGSDFHRAFRRITRLKAAEAEDPKGLEASGNDQEEAPALADTLVLEASPMSRSGEEKTSRRSVEMISAGILCSLIAGWTMIGFLLGSTRRGRDDDRRSSGAGGQSGLR